MAIDVAREYREMIIKYRQQILSYINPKKPYLTGPTGIPMLLTLAEKLQHDYESFIAAEYPKGFLAKLAGVRLKVNSISKNSTNDRNAIEGLEKMIKDL